MNNNCNAAYFGVKPEHIQLVYVHFMAVSCVVGLTGNCMVWVLIQTNRTLRKIASNVYLLALSVCSSVFLIALLMFYYELSTGISVVNLSDITCKVSVYVTHISDCMSIWLIALVCLERLLLLHRYKRSTTVAKAKTHVVALGGIVSMFELWILVVAGLRPESAPHNSTSAYQQSCDIKKDWERFYSYMTMVESLFSVVAPAFLVLVGNICVITKLHDYLKHAPSSKGSKYRSSGVSFTTGGTSATATVALNGLPDTLTYSVGSATLRTSVDRQSQQQQQQQTVASRRIRQAEITLTRSLLVVTCAFFVMNLPNYTYRMLHTFGERQILGCYTDVVASVVHLLLYSHHAVLFYLYIFYSPQMKKRLRPTATKLLECYCLKTVPDFGHYNAEGNTTDSLSLTPTPLEMLQFRADNTTPTIKIPKNPNQRFLGPDVANQRRPFGSERHALLQR